MDVVAEFALAVFRASESGPVREAALGALANLHELALATHDNAMLEAILRLTACAKGPPPTSARARSRSVEEVKSALEAYAVLLSGEGRARLMNLVRYQADGDPVHGFLRSIRGVGPKRMERLYLAGLSNLDRLCAAEPEELSVVTGLPPSLAVEVLEKSRTFAAEQRKRALYTLRDRADWLVRSAHSLNAEDPEQRGLIQGAREAIRNLDFLLARLEQT